MALKESAVIMGAHRRMEDGWLDGWIGKYARKGVGLCIPYFMHVRRETINYAFERWKGVRRM